MANTNNRQYDNLDHAIEEANTIAIINERTADYQMLEYLKLNDGYDINKCSKSKLKRFRYERNPISYEIAPAHNRAGA